MLRFPFDKNQSIALGLAVQSQLCSDYFDMHMNPCLFKVNELLVRMLQLTLMFETALLFFLFE